MQGLSSYSTPSPPGLPGAGPSNKRQRTRSHSPKRSRSSAGEQPENLSHIAQSSLPDSELASEPLAIEEEEAESTGWAKYGPQYANLSEDQVFTLATRPPPIPGLSDWGIPPAPSIDSDAPPPLYAKVSRFLDLKYDNGQHINTSLLSSTSFSNPHIYSKLVEFVDLDERRSAFPDRGWITRIGLEGTMGRYGPRALAEDQRRRQEATKRAQEVGNRTSIAFTSSRKDDRRRDGRERDRQSDGRRSRDGHGRREGHREGHRDSLGLKRDRDGGWDERELKGRRRY